MIRTAMVERATAGTNRVRIGYRSAIPLLATVFLAACGASAGSSGTANPIPSASAQEPTAMVASSASVSPSASATSEGGLTYVAFGDSWPFGAHCGGCRPFPGLVVPGLEAASGQTIHFVNDVTNGGTAAELADAMTSDAKVRADLSVADIIVIAIGGNDLQPALEASVAGTCGGADNLDCFRAVRDGLAASYDKMLTRIDELRPGKPTAVRMVTTSNEFLADPDLISFFGPTFGATRGVAITKMNRDAQCAAAVAHHALCVDLGVALNGPSLTAPQDVNTQEAMQKVADAIVAAGLPELTH
jgi:lysophospholipase L1-like esterase